MPDWQKLVGDRLAHLALDDRERQGVITELAGHLEDTYDALRRTGLPGRDAIRRALSQVDDWKSLQRRISAAKGNRMNARTSRLWFPSLVTLALSLAIEIVVGFLGLKPGPLGSHSLRPHNEIYIISDYTVWLLALPFIAALGARLSRRAGGTLREIIISSLFPALVSFVIVGLILSAMASRGYGFRIPMESLGPFGIITVLVLIPGACLLLGVFVHQGAAKLWRKSAA